MFRLVTGPPSAAQLTAFRNLYFRLAQDWDHAVLLDSCGFGTGGFYTMGFGADWVVQLLEGQLWVNGQHITDIDNKTQLWDTLETLFQQSKAQAPPASEATAPFVDGWFGTVGYELNSLLEPRVPSRERSTPLGELYWIHCPHRILWWPEQGVFIVESPDPRWREQVYCLLEQGPAPSNFSLPTGGMMVSSFSQADFETGVERILEHIRAGDIYQANLSIRFALEAFPNQALEPLYLALAERNPSPFSGMFKTPVGTLVCNSPERLIKYDSTTNILETRPIAGTRGRGSTPEEEALIDQTLQEDEKEQAEHLMLVDLERHDLGRVAQPASVAVTEAFVLEKYSHVTHLVSQIEGQKAPLKSRWEVLEAMFPGGTITGCPKVRCMEILAGLEPVPRGLYTGSLGYLDFRGNLDFNILIRSLYYWPDQQLHYHVGAGIVADSVPAHEYRECLRKAQAIQGVLGQ